MRDQPVIPQFLIYLPNRWLALVQRYKRHFSVNRYRLGHQYIAAPECVQFAALNINLKQIACEGKIRERTSTAWYLFINFAPFWERNETLESIGIRFQQTVHPMRTA